MDRQMRFGKHNCPGSPAFAKLMECVTNNGKPDLDAKLHTPTS